VTVAFNTVPEEGVSANFVASLAQRFHYGNALLAHLNSEESVWSERESTALAVVVALPDTVVKPAGNPLTSSLRAEPTGKPQTTYYWNCDAIRAAWKAPIQRGAPGLCATP
jgi:hypothetical protein